MDTPDAIIVGAGPAGLACASQMQAAGLVAAVLEKADTVGSVWRRHYDRLHLHTDRNHSGLPDLPMPASYPKYPSCAQVVAYFENYATHFGIKPIFRAPVARITRDGETWCVEAGRTWRAPIVVIATGTASAPYRPTWPGTDAYRGAIVHSSDYRNPAPYAGQRVLVVGFGNSGGEIALDLAEAGVDVALAVRGPVQILPRDLLGLPILSWAILYQRLPARLVDAINAPILRLALGRVDALGLQLATKGPRRMVEENQRVPLIDIGTLGAIRAGRIKLRGSIDRLVSNDTVFVDGKRELFDAIILATGYRPDLRPLLPGVEGVLDARGMPLATGRTTAAPGLYFCGQITSPTGQLREIGIEAQRIAKLARSYIRQSRAAPAPAA